MISLGVVDVGPDLLPAILTAQLYHMFLNIFPLELLEEAHPVLSQILWVRTTELQDKT